MTALDAAVLALLTLIGTGGYHQGLLRGLTRLSALLAIGLLALILSIGLTTSIPITALVLRTLALIAAVTLIVGLLTWLINRAVPRRYHELRINRILGIVPAILQGLIVLSLLLGLYQRVALAQETQRYIAGGAITGRLIEPIDWLEQSLAGVR